MTNAFETLTEEQIARRLELGLPMPWQTSDAQQKAGKAAEDRHWDRLADIQQDPFKPLPPGAK